jgi:hypothetical protein
MYAPKNSCLELKVYFLMNCYHPSEIAASICSTRCSAHAHLFMQSGKETGQPSWKMTAKEVYECQYNRKFCRPLLYHPLWREDYINHFTLAIDQSSFTACGHCTGGFLGQSSNPRSPGSGDYRPLLLRRADEKGKEEFHSKNTLRYTKTWGYATRSGLGVYREIHTYAYFLIKFQ